jgi:hypothetical protein
MALPQQLKSARMSDATDADTIDNNIGDLEAALCDIFGFTIDTDVTASPFSCDNSGRITKQLIIQKAAGPVGWRFRDSTSGKEVRAVLNGSVFQLDENTSGDPDPETNPTWTTRFSINISTGAMTGNAASTSAMGLCPQGSGDNTEYLDGTLNWSTPAGGSTVPVVRLRHSANQSLSSGSAVALDFDTEDVDTDTMHNGVDNPSRITIVTSGKYLVIGGCSFTSNATGSRALSIYKNGTTFVARYAIGAAPTLPTIIEVRSVLNLVAGDYVQLKAEQDSGSSLNALSVAEYSPVFSAYKVG